jgi:hypothetical protein
MSSIILGHEWLSLPAHGFSASGSSTLPLATSDVCCCRIFPLAGQFRDIAVVFIVIGIVLAAATAAHTSDSR